MLSQRLRALQAAHQVIPALAAELSREQVISRVESALDSSLETYEKEGWVVVGWIHLRFDDQGQVVEIGPDLD